jgi:hypothetical protein
MNTVFSAVLIILFNLLVSYFISFYSFSGAIGWFCFAVGFQFGQWYMADKKEKQFISREEIIREEYEKN